MTLYPSTDSKLKIALMRVFFKATVSPPSLAQMCRERIASMPGLVVSTIGLGKTSISVIDVIYLQLTRKLEMFFGASCHAVSVHKIVLSLSE